MTYPDEVFSKSLVPIFEKYEDIVGREISRKEKFFIHGVYAAAFADGVKDTLKRLGKDYKDLVNKHK